MGSGLQLQGPPAMTSGYRSSLSDAYTGMPARSSIFKTLVNDNSYWSVKPMILNSDTECFDSSENRGILFLRSYASISWAGA